MSKATDHFKNDAYVKDYYQKAQENQAIMNGTHESTGGVTPKWSRWRCHRATLVRRQPQQRLQPLMI